MINQNFHGESIPQRVSFLAQICGATQKPTGQDKFLSGVATLEKATPDDLSLFSHTRYATDLKKTKAGAVLVTAQAATDVPKGCLALIVPNVLLAYGQAVSFIYPESRSSSTVHKTAYVDPSAQLARDVSVGPYSVIQAHAQIGEGTTIGAHTVIGPHVEIGERCQIADHVTISFAIIGNFVRIHAGARIGEPGFGVIPTPQGPVFIRQLGCVRIGSQVRIGANTTIDRGSIDDTVIGDGTVIDNLVQIAHNIHIGKNCTLVSQVGLAGSCSLGDNVVLAGKVGVAGHVHIGEGVTAAAKSGITHDIPAGKTVGGFPAEEVVVWRRQVATLKNLARRKTKDDATRRNA
ncbi:MAG: UDP-3-O-(3-hydroxymyristoyl)glucosamine N-acyltransferase [Holosporales bacterium]|nr:UDP-3-O-(3-hydroxymyristoyl)glucosamine N-acyltransferase [Holosporales bacterium]